MIKRLIFSALVFMAIVLPVFSQSMQQWNRVHDLNTLEAYQKFLDKYPDGIYSTLTKQCMEQLEYPGTKKTNTIEAYTAYLKKYPDGLYYKQVIESMEVLEFAEAKKKNIRECYLAFLLKYPDGANHFKAQQCIAHIDFDSVKQTNTTEAYGAFLKKYPEGIYADSAKSRMNGLFEEQDWQQAVTENTVEAFERYINLNPSGAKIAEARARITELKVPGIVLAAKADDIEKIRALISKGDDVNINSDGYSALMYASLNGNLDMVKLLVENGADINFQTKTKSAISLSDEGNYYEDSKSSHPAIVNYLVDAALKSRDKRTPALDTIRNMVWRVINHAKMNAGSIGMEIYTAKRNEKDNNIITITGEAATWGGSAMYGLGMWEIDILFKNNKWTASGSRLENIDSAQFHIAAAVKAVRTCSVRMIASNMVGSIDISKEHPLKINVIRLEVPAASGNGNDVSIGIFDHCSVKAAKETSMTTMKNFSLGLKLTSGTWTTASSTVGYVQSGEGELEARFTVNGNSVYFENTTIVFEDNEGLGMMNDGAKCYYNGRLYQNTKIGWIESR